MEKRLLEAAASGDVVLMKHMALHDLGVLRGETQQGNTCLHISATNGHERFCTDVLSLDPSLVSAVNKGGETPLVVTVTNGHVSLASVLLKFCHEQGFKESILRQDSNGFNALHHAIRSGHRDLALELVLAEPSLSTAVNNYNESPMFIAVMRDFTDVFEALLKIPDSAHTGAASYNALHAAVRNGNSVIARRIMETRPELAKEEEANKDTPIHLAVLWDKIDVLKVLLEHDHSLGYVVSTDGATLLNTAAVRNQVGAARELLNYCPDAPYCNIAKGWTCLHAAVWHGHTEFVKFALGSQHLRKLVNMRDENGRTPLYLAVQKCNPKIITVLLLHPDIDVTVIDNKGGPPTWTLPDALSSAKTLKWNEVSMLMLKADPKRAVSIYNLHKEIKDKITDASRKDVRSLTQTYTSNTSLVAILMATITFAAAFTLPGGYSSDDESKGLPIMSRKIAFQAFLISDTLAMCSSLAVAFICVIARWEDLEFLLYYRSFTKKVMWFAYVATTTAFATGLYTVLAPRLLWLAITICVLSILMPLVTKMLGAWPVLKLRLRLGRTFKSDLLDMV